MNLSSEQWSDLAERTRLGDEQACCALADALGGLLRAFFRKNGLRTSDAEDLAVTCVSDIVLRLDAFHAERGTSFKAWVYGIAKHRRADFFRKRGARAEQVFATEPAAPLDADLASATSVGGQDLRQAVEDALSQLNATDRRIIEARLGREPVPYEALAWELEISSAACRKRYERLLRKLRLWLESDARTASFRQGWRATGILPRESTLSGISRDEPRKDLE